MQPKNNLKKKLIQDKKALFIKQHPLMTASTSPSTQPYYSNYYGTVFQVEFNFYCPGCKEINRIIQDDNNTDILNQDNYCNICNSLLTMERPPNF